MGRDIPRQKPGEQHPGQRIKNFNEVSTGFSEETAIAEAERCIQCKKPHCIKGCPVNVDIPGFIAAIVEGDFSRSFQILKDTNSLPAICGRVCPQESQCEMFCVLGKKYEPVAIGALERFVADHEREAGKTAIPVIQDSKQKKVAVIGSGPAGLTVAGDLRKKGYPVTIFEALHSPGGVLVYGIPEFRLPKKVVEYEIDALSRMGVDMVLNRAIGMSETIDDMLNNGYDAVFVGSGAG
ncbi:MAG TPA: NAD(P)-binding protein, partial [Spirochaetota bacterium]|nr:NAD(P)-binding protein [Spirochaetota bacterium]